MSEPELADAYGILDAEDREIVESQDSPALQSVPGDDTAWESFNRWLCFPVDSLKLECRDYAEDREWETIDPEEREGEGYISVMDIEHQAQHYRIEPPGWMSLRRCHDEIEQIDQLLEGQAGFCVFAAELPAVSDSQGQSDGGSSVWVRYGIKTRLGRWMAPIYDFEESPLAEGDRESSDPHSPGEETER